MTGLAYRLDAVGLRIDDAVILEDVTFDVAYGRVLALVGPNGAGKSSLLGILSGDVAATGGSVLLDDRPLGDFRPKQLSRRRAVLLQSNHVAFGFTAHEVVEMGRAPWAGSGVDEDAAVIARSMERADVTHLASRVYSSLSGGEKARASLARVLAQSTPIVMLDEPTAALDLRHQEDVLRIARELAADGNAVIVVLHDLSLAAAYADEVAMIAGGRLAAIGDAADVLTAERIETVYGTPVRIVPDPDTGRPVVLPRRSR